MINKFSVLLFVGLLLTGCTLTLAPLPTPTPPTAELHPVYNVITSCTPLVDYVDLNPATIGVFDGVMDGEPAESESGFWYTHINVTDPDGQQCRIELHADSLAAFGNWTDGDQVRVIAGYSGRGSGRSPEGVSYPLHVFFLPGDV